MKKNYIIPAAEEVENLLAAAILGASGDGEIDGYDEGNDFTW